MRENRLYGSEGGEAKSLPYPYQTKPQLETPGLGRVALLAMTESAVDSVAEGPGRPPIRES